MKRIVFLFSFLAIQLTAFSQLGVGTNSPDASAQLDVTATNKGFLAPRIALISTSDVTTIAAPATGLMVYNTATAGTAPSNVIPGYYFFNGIKWVRFINTQADATINFNTANPNSGSPVFTPNTPQSADFVYVSDVNSSLWIWNGTNYVTYTPPASTPFFLSGSTFDAGSNKTSSIYRTGTLGLGFAASNSVSTAATLDVNGNSLFRSGNSASVFSANQLLFSWNATSFYKHAIKTRHNTLASDGNAIDFYLWNQAVDLAGDVGTKHVMTIDGTVRVGVGITSPVTTLHVNNPLTATASVNASAQVLRLSRPTTSSIKWDNIAQFNLGSYSSNVAANSRLDLALTDGTNATTLTNVMTWLANGNVGIGTTSPISSVHIQNPLLSTNTVNANGAMLRLARPLNGGVKFPNIAQFNLGSFTTGGQSNTRLDLVLSNVNDSDLPTIMTWQANGNVGLGTTAPNGAVTLYGPSSLPLPVNIQGSGGPTKELVFGRGGLTAGFAAITGVDNGQYGGGLSFIVKPSGSDNFPTNAIQAMVLDWNGNMGLGTGSPTQRLDVNGRIRIRTIDTGVASDSILVVNGGVIKKVTKSAGVNIQTADYTLTASDNGNIVIMNSATAVTVTVPATLPAGFVVQIIQKGAGQVTVSGSGSTINSANGLKTRVTNSAIGVVMETSTLGYVTGDSNF